MRLITIFLSVILSFASHVYGQIRTISGKIIDEELNPVYHAGIHNTDTTLLITTNEEGNFKIDVPDTSQSLIISSIGMEWKLLRLQTKCDYLEIILLNSGSYDFISARKVDRLRKKQFEGLTELHRTAYNKGIFKFEKPCYEEKFVPIKERLKDIHKRRNKISGN